MIYIYNCFGGTHSSVLAVAYHLKKLNSNHEPTKEEILGCHNFNKLDKKDRGRLYYYGIDDEGNKVYNIARGRSKILVPGMYSLASVLQKDFGFKERIIFSNTSPTVPICMTFGGMFSRWMKIDCAGVPLLVKGAQQNYKVISRLVEHTKQFAHTCSDPICILKNDEFAYYKR